jgi:hypothetical protein
MEPKYEEGKECRKIRIFSYIAQKNEKVNFLHMKDIFDKSICHNDIDLYL